MFKFRDELDSAGGDGFGKELQCNVYAEEFHVNDHGGKRDCDEESESGDVSVWDECDIDSSAEHWVYVCWVERGFKR